MNTIHSTFNFPACPNNSRAWKNGFPPYTAIGGTKRSGTDGLSAILLNRGSRYPRKTLFQQLQKIGFDYILSVECGRENYDIEELSELFPFVRFILVKNKISAGEAINLAAIECSSPYFFVLWNDYRFFNGINSAKMVEYHKDKRLCTTPTIQNSKFEILHTLVSPVYLRNSHTIKALPEIPVRENQSTIFPHDWLGFYDKEKFLRLGGFDRDIINPYWQLMDFGFRAYLWGEELRSTQMIRLVHDGAGFSEDDAADDSYRLFYLKNLVPQWRSGHIYLPLRSFPRYLAKTGWDLPCAWNEFSRERRWVLKNRRRFCRDARALTDLWEDIAGAAL